jgi:hypothetical protein
LTLPPRWSWNRKDLTARDVAATTWAPPLQTLTLKTENGALKTGDRALPPTRTEIYRASMAQRLERQVICGGADGRQMGSRSPGETLSWT